METPIRHAGIVQSIDGEHVRVKILQHSACNSCKIAAHCSASESKEKIIDVYENSNFLQIGQEVVVSTSTLAVRKALVLGFAIPLTVMMIVIVILLMTGSSDGFAAFMGLASLVPYYYILWLLRKRIAKGIQFLIEK